MEIYKELDEKILLPQNVEMVRAFLLHYEHVSNSPHTVRRHRGVLQRFFSTFPHAYMDVTDDVITEWLVEQRKQWSEKTVKEYRKTLRVFYNFAVESNKMEQSPLPIQQSYWEIEEGVFHPRNRAVINEFLASQRDKNSKETILRQRNTLRQFFSTQEDTFTAITTKDIEKWLAEQRKKRPPTTVNHHYLKNLRTFYAYCVEAKYLAQSPVQAIATPGISARKPWELRIALANQENHAVVTAFLQSLDKAKQTKASIAKARVYLQDFFKENATVFTAITSTEIEKWLNVNKVARNQVTLGGVRNTLRFFYTFCLTEGHVHENPVPSEAYWVLVNPMLAKENRAAINAYLLKLKQRNRSEKAIKNRKFILQKFFKDMDLPFSDVQTADVEQWVSTHQSAWKAKTKGTYLSVLRSFYQFCDQQAYTHQSPVKPSWGKGNEKKDSWLSQKPFVNAGNQETLNEYLSYLKLANLSPLTIQNYRYFLDNFFKDRTACFSALTPPEVLQWLKQEQDRIAKATVKYRLSVLSSFYQFCVSEDYVTRIPLKARWSPRLSKPLPLYLDKTEVASVRAVSEKESLRDRAIFELLLTSGCRVAEVQMLNREDLDLDNRVARVIGKGRKIRQVHFQNTCAIILQRYFDSRSDHNPAIFVSRWGTRLSTHSMYQIVKRMGEAAGIKGSLYPHRLRHTFATDLRTKGASLSLIADFLGHLTEQTTKIYARVPEWKLISEYRKYMG